MKKKIQLLYSKISVNLIWSFASKGFAAVALILIDILLARSLEPDLYGNWQRFFSLLSILLFVVYAGIPSAAEAFVARNNNKPVLKHVLRDSLLLQILFSMIATGIILLLRNQIAALAQQPQFGHLVLMAAPYLMMGALEEYLKSVFVGLKRVKNHFFMNVFSFGFRLVFLGILFIYFRDIPFIIVAYSLAIGLAVIVGVILYNRQYRHLSESVSQRPIFIRKVFIYSLPLAFTMVIGLSLPEINVLMLGTLATSREVAYLSVGKQITSKLPQIAMAVSMGVMPDYAQISVKNLHEKKKNFLRILKLNLFLFTGLAGLIIFICPWAIPFFYGEEYGNAVLPLQILSGNIIFSSFMVYLSTLLNYQGKAGKRAFLMLLSLVLNIFLNILLIPIHGAVGSALALTITSIFHTVLLFVFTWRILKK
jgi:O-antigen/teichoic acid export membrane protein